MDTHLSKIKKTTRKITFFLFFVAICAVTCFLHYHLKICRFFYYFLNHLFFIIQVDSFIIINERHVNGGELSVTDLEY